jgi:3-hydroxyisobutyrate dehydrogenase-like beta-hydroxyacid dehydrogenase
VTTLGFIGLGRMGNPMATHLVRDDHDVVVFDKRSEAVDEVVTTGARGADSTAAVGERADVIFLSVPGPAAVKSVVSELEPTIESGSAVVDLTTSTPSTTQTVAEQLADEGVTVLGAPVSGGVSGAEDGTLSVMAGGDRATYEACREYLDAFATDVFHLGPDPGYGHAVKLLNNYLSTTATVATAEAVVLGQQIGLDIETLCEVFNASSGRNSSTEEKFPDYIANDRDIGFTLGLAEKDLRLAHQFADENRVPLLLGSIVRSQYSAARAAHGADGDMRRIHDFVREYMVAAEEASEDEG